MKAQLATLTLGIALLSAACGDRADSSSQPDSALAHDLALASAQPAAPSFQDTALAPAPTKAVEAPKKERPAPVRKPAATAPKTETPPPPPTRAPEAQPQPQSVAPAAAPAPVEHAEIASGATGVLTAGSKVCSGVNMVGDKIVATLTSPITGTHGAEIPAGANVVLEVASITSGDKAETASITFRVRSIVVNDKTYNVSADVTPAAALEKTKVSSASGSSDSKKKVIGGAIAGAVLGQIIGRDAKGAIIGAAAGAATGAAVAKAGGSTEKWEACLPSGAQMQIKLNAPLVLM